MRISAAGPVEKGASAGYAPPPCPARWPFLLPFIDRMDRVDLRTVTLTIPPQEVITRD